jgi:hypothetical protein
MTDITLYASSPGYIAPLIKQTVSALGKGSARKKTLLGCGVPLRGGNGNLRKFIGAFDHIV